MVGSSAVLDGDRGFVLYEWIVEEWLRKSLSSISYVFAAEKHEGMVT